METQHRDAIQDNYSSLVEQTDLDLMVAVLYEKGVFSEPMIEPYKNTSLTVRDRKRLLYRDITRRGPDAFRHLLDALMENGYWGLVRSLDPQGLLGHIKSNPRHGEGENSFLSLYQTKRTTGKEQNDPNQNQNPVPCRSTQERVEPERNANSILNTHKQDEDKIPSFDVKKSTKFFEDTKDIKLYRTRGRRRGVLLLFSYIEFVNGIEHSREGATVDIENLSHLFTEIGFKVLRFTNLTLKETKETLESTSTPGGICAERPEAVFVVFSSHGYGRRHSGDTELRCHDGHLISYYEIVGYFNNEKFPELNGIPKVFIFQTCRGDNEVRACRMPPPARRGRTARDGSAYAAGADAAAALSAHDSSSRLYSDILIAHSTLPGYASNRDKVSGSWYIQALCEVFAARAHDTHLEKLLKFVDTRLQDRFSLQTSSVDSWGFNRRLYLHPGLYED